VNDEPDVAVPPFTYESYPELTFCETPSVEQGYGRGIWFHVASESGFGVWPYWTACEEPERKFDSAISYHIGCWGETGLPCRGCVIAVTAHQRLGEAVDPRVVELVLRTREDAEGDG